MYLHKMIMILLLGTLIASPSQRIDCRLFGKCSEKLFDQVRDTRNKLINRMFEGKINII